MTATLTLIRDESIPVETLARLFGESEAFVAGLLDIVTGNQDWRLMFDADSTPTQAECDDYTRGAMLAEQLLDAESGADVWAAVPVELVPVPACDVPW